MLAAKPLKPKPAPAAGKASNSAEPPAEAEFNPAWGRLAWGIQPKLRSSQPEVSNRRPGATLPPASAHAGSLRAHPEVIQRKVGWSGSLHGSMNADENLVGEMRRIPIEGLSSIHSASPSQGDGRAIVLFRSDLSAAQPVKESTTPLVECWCTCMGIIKATWSRVAP